MISLILRTAARFLHTLLLLFSIFLLLRGHNEPGGGFVGGLVAAAAFALYCIAYDVAAARRALALDPKVLLGAGLLLAAGSGLLPLGLGLPFLTGLWSAVASPPGFVIELGSPLFFDTGVYLVVVGAVLTILFAIAEE